MPTDPKPPPALLPGLLAASVLLFALELLVERHPYFEVEHWLGFHGIVGAGACLLAVLVALLLRAVARRPEDYYDR